jgi:predicted DNA-binding protein
MSRKTVRRSIGMTQEMRDRLAQLVSKQPRNTTEADLIREAIRLYLDDQEDLIGSRKHFQKSLQVRIDQLEHALSFHLNILVYLVIALNSDRKGQHLTDAILAAKRGNDALITQIKAVRDLK